MREMNRMGTIRDLLDIIDQTKEIYEENEEKIDEMLEKIGLDPEEMSSMKADTPVKNVTVTDEEVNITVAFSGSNAMSVSTDFDEKTNMLSVESKSERMRFKLPDDIIIEDAVQESKHGVVSMTVPRGE